jgi:hypothetical protein
MTAGTRLVEILMPVLTETTILEAVKDRVMTREAAKTGVEEFLERTVDATREEFQVERALRGTGLGPGGMVIDRLRDNVQTMERKLVEPELAEYRDRSLAQFDVLVEYMETDAPIRQFEEPLLATDSYLESLDSSASAATRKQLVDASLERLNDSVTGSHLSFTATTTSSGRLSVPHSPASRH